MLLCFIFSSNMKKRLQDIKFLLAAGNNVTIKIFLSLSMRWLSITDSGNAVNLLNDLVWSSIIYQGANVSPQLFERNSRCGVITIAVFYFLRAISDEANVFSIKVNNRWRHDIGASVYGQNKRTVTITGYCSRLIENSYQ